MSTPADALKGYKGKARAALEGWGVRVWSDVRASNNIPSHPGELQWAQWFKPGEYQAHLFAQAILRIHQEDSISSLFEIQF